MYVDFEASTEHAHRVRDATLIVNRKFLRKNVDDLAVRRQRHRPGRFDSAPYIIRVDFTRPRWNRSHTQAVEALDVAAGQSHINLFDFASGHGLGFADAFLDRLDSGFKIDDRPFLIPLDSAIPTPIGFSCESAMSVHTLVEPMSRPTTIFSVRPMLASQRFRHLSS